MATALQIRLEEPGRTFDQVRAHYAVERELADRLRRAPKGERLALYNTVYDELFRRVPSHPQLLLKGDDQSQRLDVAKQLVLLRRFLFPGCTYMEIGAGDCAVPRAVAAQTRQVYAVDVSEEIAAGVDLPANVEFVLSDGTSIPVPPASVDVVYSNQLMEHLHPDDAGDQLRNIAYALRPGGVYVCVTPSRLTGPHDVSKYFDPVATGFHLMEYTVGDLVPLFRQAGFRRFQVALRSSRAVVLLPTWPVVLLEGLLSRLPFGRRRRVARLPVLNALLGIKLVATR